MAATPIYYESFEVGRIDVSEGGVSFVYDNRWRASRNAFPISLTMPLDRPEHPAHILLPWLSNLLPEAQALRTVGGRLGIAPEDVVGMLRHIGQDTAGALSIGRPREGAQPAYRPIESDAALERIINDLPAKPFLVGEAGVSMSLAGVQTKLPLAVFDGALAVPVNRAPSTHILKPDGGERLFGSVQNEALCLTLARLVGLDAAAVTTGVAGTRSYLLVTRFDRHLDAPGRWLRLHQEDFCQALGKPPAAKYEHNQTGIKGPSLKDMLGLLDEKATAADRIALLDGIIFNVLINNADSHAKNYSIYLLPDGPQLAPLYDLMCAAPCWDVTQNMAQAIDGKNRGNHIHGQHWQRLARACGLNPTAVLRRVEDLATATLAQAPAATAAVEAMPAGGHPLLGEFSGTIEHRCRAVLQNLPNVETEEAP